MADKDYYKILGIDKNATKEEIKKAYKRLAKQYHPDLNKSHDAAEKFKEINEAASVLGDDAKKSQYDKHGSAGQQFEGFSGFDFSDFSDMKGFGFDFDEIFDSFIGGGSRARRKQRGSDLRYELEIELEDTANGAVKQIVVPRLEQCEACRGSGADRNSDIVTCDECNGRGVKTSTQRTPFGLFSTTTTCRKCRGGGKYAEEECNLCRGSGIIKKTRKIDVRIPAGADNGTALRLEGEGEAGKDAHPGDLYIVIGVKPHKIFSREGDDLYIKSPVSFATAAIGGEIEVPTLNGNASLKIPAGTQSNTIFRMRGNGMPRLNGHGHGDEKVEVVVDVPSHLTKRQKELLEQFEKEDGKKGVFNKLFNT